VAPVARVVADKSERSSSTPLTPWRAADGAPAGREFRNDSEKSLK
jgi:hypothetical protein